VYWTRNRVRDGIGLSIFWTPFSGHVSHICVLLVQHFSIQVWIGEGYVCCLQCLRVCVQLISCSIHSISFCESCITGFLTYHMFPYLIHSSEYNGSSRPNFFTEYNTVVTHVPLYTIILIPVILCMNVDYR